MFFNTFQPVVNSTITFLKLLNVKVSSVMVDNTLHKHPDYPSLLAVSDSLQEWNVPNATFKMEPHRIDEIPVPFLAYLPDSLAPLTVVTNVNVDKITCYTDDYKKPVLHEREDFLKQWHGICLLAETNDESGEKNYKQNRGKELLKQSLPFSLLLILLAGSLYILYSSGATLMVYMQYCILLAGTIITSLLLWYEIDRNNPLLYKVCGGISQGNCGAILTSKASTFLGLFTWSEVGFIYFVGGLLTLLFASLTVALPILGWFHILSLPYIFFSVFYQWRIAKQWCILCLTVQVLLLAGGLNVFINGYALSITALTTKAIFTIVTLYLLPALVWYIVKPILKKLQHDKDEKRQYLRIKFNYEVFDTLIKKQKKITLPTSDLGIDLGNVEANNLLIKVCSPYCNPCSLAHPDIEKLLEENKNLKVKIIFTTVKDEKDFRFKTVAHLLAIAEKGNKKLTMQALDDWYLSPQKNYDIFASKYQMNGEVEMQSKKIHEMENWCKQVNIQFTPTIFFNGYQIPDAYNVGDLGYFLKQ